MPDGVDAGELAAYCLTLGDDALVSPQRLAEWCTRAPELEEEVALANIGLDLLGQARLLYARAGQVDGTGRDEDAYAYFRDAGDFRNVRAGRTARSATSRSRSCGCWCCPAGGSRTSNGSPTHRDPVLAAIAAKGVKELTYHRQYAAEWAVRLGDGTDESHRRMRTALDQVAPFLGELFARACDVPGRGRVDRRCAARSTRSRQVRRRAAHAAGPARRPGAGRDGQHTEHLAPLLAELQSVARAHPEATW